MDRKLGRDFMRAYRCLGAGMPVPGRVAQVIDTRKMGGGGDVGQRHALARQPGPPFHEIGDVFQVMLNVGMTGADRAGIGLSRRRDPFDDLFAHEVFGDLGVELAIEPGDEPADLRAGRRRPADHRRLGMHLLQILGDGGAVAHGGSVGLHQDRYVAGGVEREKFGSAFPHRFQLRLELQLFLGEKNRMVRQNGDSHT